MDPGGRALRPLERFREAAERFGWIVMSSYNSRSDRAEDPNAAALTAMVEDANDLLSVDPRRIYLAGFSGTARISWVFAQQLGNQVAGVLGFGAGLPGLYLLPSLAEGRPQSKLAYFGGAGTTDFNYDELHELDRALDDLPVEHRILYYPGPHAWPPEEVMASALAWMELQAMKVGLRPVDSRLVDDLYEQDLSTVHRLGEEGWLPEAHALLRSILRDYGGLRNTETAEGDAADMASSDGFQSATRQLARLGQEAEEYRVRFARLLEEYDSKKKPPRLEKSLDRLSIEKLKKRATGQERRDALAAQRLLATVFTQTSFYKPGDYLAQGQPAKAVAMLGIARAIQPESGRVCLQMARARAAAGEVEEAVIELRCALEKKAVSADAVERDSYLQQILDAPEVRQILEDMARQRPPQSISAMAAFLLRA